MRGNVMGSELQLCSFIVTLPSAFDCTIAGPLNSRGNSGAKTFAIAVMLGGMGAFACVRVHNCTAATALGGSEIFACVYSVAVTVGEISANLCHESRCWSNVNMFLLGSKMIPKFLIASNPRMAS